MQSSICLICHRPLTAPASIAAGIGPECAATYAVRIAAAGSSVKGIEQLAALDEAQVNRWLRLARLAISADHPRDVRQFLAAAETAAQLVKTTPAARVAPAAPAPAPLDSREIIIRRDNRDRLVFCPPRKDQELIMTSNAGSVVPSTSPASLAATSPITK